MKQKNNIESEEITEALDKIKNAITRDVTGELLSESKQREYVMLVLKVITAIPVHIKLSTGRQLRFRSARQTVKTVNGAFSILNDMFTKIKEHRRIE